MGRTSERLPHVLVDRVGTVIDTVELPEGCRVIGETVTGLVYVGDATVGLWEPTRDAVVREHPAWFPEVADGRSVISSFNDELTVWDTSNDLVRPLTLPSGVEWNSSCQVSPTGPFVAWASGNGSSARRAIVVCDVSTGDVEVADSGFDRVGSLCWSADASHVLFASFDERVVRCLSVGGDVDEVVLRRPPGNLLCDLGGAPAPITHSRLLVDFDEAAPRRIAATTSGRSLRRDVAAALRDTVGRTAAKAVLELALPALVLEPHDDGRSWIGGTPVLESRTDGPEYNGRPLAHLATLDLGDLRRAWRGSPLPAKGRLAFFFGPLDEDGSFDEVCAVMQASPRAVASQAPDGVICFERVPVRPRLVLTLPVDLDEAVGPDAAALSERLFDELFACSGPLHQVGGHGRWVQEPEVGLLLLQVDSDSEAGMTWGDGGMVYFVADSWPAAGSASAVRATMQCC